MRTSIIKTGNLIFAKIFAFFLKFCRFFYKSICTFVEKDLLQIFLTSFAISNNREEKDTWALLIDIKSAFDTVNHEILF